MSRAGYQQGAHPRRPSRLPRIPQLSSGAVARRIYPSFHLITASEQRWNSHSISLRSPVIWARLASSSLTNARVVRPQDPLVSNTAGWNRKRPLRWPDFLRFTSSAHLAVPSAAVDAAVRRLWVHYRNVLTTIIVTQIVRILYNSQ